MLVWILEETKYGEWVGDDVEVGCPIGSEHRSQGTL